jgi:hypothetical protein
MRLSQSSEVSTVNLLHSRLIKTSRSQSVSQLGAQGERIAEQKQHLNLLNNE